VYSTKVRLEEGFDDILIVSGVPVIDSPRLDYKDERI